MRKVKENERPTSERQKFSGRLQVRVVKAANLLAKKWNGLADSYCIIKLEQRSIKTKVMVGTLNPEWNQQFMMNMKHPFSSFEFTIWDKAIAAPPDLCMGQVTIPLAKLSVQTSDGQPEVIRKWYKLEPRDSTDQVRGEVELEFQYTHIRAWSSLYEGVRQYNATQYLKAIPLLTASLATMPDCMELLSYRSQCYLKARKCDAAMADADEMIASWPNEPEGYLRKGQVFFVNLMYDEARAEFYKGLDQNPTHPELNQCVTEIDRNATRREITVKLNSARRSFKEKRYEEALPLFSFVIQKNPSSYLFYVYRAICSMGLRNFSDAKLDIMKSVEEQPSWPKTHVTKQGYLKKEGEVNRMMKRRWFILNMYFLFYYKTSKDLVPTGVILVDHVLEKKGNWIGLQSLGRTYLLKAAKKEEAAVWRSTLKRVTAGDLMLPEEPEDGAIALWVPSQDSKRATSKFMSVKFRPGDVMLTLTGAEGYLYKLGSIKKSWLHRWFIIMDNAMYYFEYKQVDRSHPVTCKGAIVLETATVRDVAPSEILGQSISLPAGDLYLFAITIGDQQIYLYAENEEERAKWRTAIREIRNKTLQGDLMAWTDTGNTTMTSSEMVVSDDEEIELEEEDDDLKEMSAPPPSFGKTTKTSSFASSPTTTKKKKNETISEQKDLPTSLADLSCPSGSSCSSLSIPSSATTSSYIPQQRISPTPNTSSSSSSTMIIPESPSFQRIKEKSKEELTTRASAAENRYFANLGISDPSVAPVTRRQDSYDSEKFDSFDERMLGGKEGGDSVSQVEEPLLPRRQKVREDPEEKCCSCTIL